MSNELRLTAYGLKLKPYQDRKRRKRMSKYTLTLLTLLLAALFALAACAPETAPATQAPAPTTAPAEPVAEEPTAEPEVEEPVEEEVVEEVVEEEAEPTAEPVQEEEVVAEEPAPSGEKKIATFVFTQEWDSLNPIYTSMWFSGITGEIWNTSAWAFDETNTPQPKLVTEIPSIENGGISEDGTVITLNLRDDIVWSDGTPITANDFVFTHAMVVDPANTVNSTYPYDLMTSVEAADAQTVVITFAEPFVPWASAVFTFLLPQHVLQPVYDAEGTLDTAEWNRNPTISGGPYVLQEWQSGSYAHFVRNENYYNAPAIIDEIFIRFVPDDAGQVAALRTGEADLGTFLAYSDVPTLEAEGVEILSVPSGYNEGWFFYLGEGAHPAIQDVNVRKAIAMGVDRFALNQDLLLNLTQPAITFWDNTPYQTPGLEAYPYDPVMAAQLLDEAGWVDSDGDGIRDKDGVALSLVHGTTTRAIRADMQAVAQQQLAELGIELEILGFPSDVYFANFANGGPCATGQLDICQSSNTTFYPDPDTSRFLCRQIATAESPDGSNDQGLCDPALDELFALQSGQVDFAERQATFHEIGQYMYDNVYWLGIWRDPDLWALSGRLENVKLSGATPFFNITEWDLSE
jgi:peptide/nickel transport system substrate-binding protein